MALPLLGFFPWLVGLFGSSLGAIMTWLMARVVYEKALFLTTVTAFIIASGSLFVTLALGIKAAIFAARVAMPSSIGLATYFLPSNINSIMAIIVTLRVSIAIYRWTVKVMASYLPLPSNYGCML